MGILAQTTVDEAGSIGVDGTLVVGIIALGLSATVLVGAVIRFLFGKREEVNLAFRKIPSDVLSVDVNMRKGFNGFTGADPD